MAKPLIACKRISFEFENSQCFFYQKAIQIENVLWWKILKQRFRSIAKVGDTFGHMTLLLHLYQYTTTNCSRIGTRVLPWRLRQMPNGAFINAIETSFSCINRHVMLCVCFRTVLRCPRRDTRRLSRNHSRHRRRRPGPTRSNSSYNRPASTTTRSLPYRRRSPPRSNWRASKSTRYELLLARYIRRVLWMWRWNPVTLPHSPRIVCEELATTTLRVKMSNDVLV